MRNQLFKTGANIHISELFLQSMIFTQSELFAKPPIKK